MNFTNSPTLKHFILKQKVLNLYRSALRASRGTFFLDFIQPTIFLTVHRGLLKACLIP